MMSCKIIFAYLENSIKAREIHLHSGSTRLEGHDELIFLRGKLGVNINHSAALAHGLVDVGLRNGNLLLVLLLVLTKLGALEVGLRERGIDQNLGHGNPTMRYIYIFNYSFRCVFWLKGAHKFRDLGDIHIEPELFIHLLDFYSQHLMRVNRRRCAQNKMGASPLSIIGEDHTLMSIQICSHFQVLASK